MDQAPPDRLLPVVIVFSAAALAIILCCACAILYAEWDQSPHGPMLHSAFLRAEHLPRYLPW